jgi:hypothetical protein
VLPGRRVVVVVVVVMVYNATFNNISVTSIAWLPVLLLEETGVPGVQRSHGESTFYFDEMSI